MINITKTFYCYGCGICAEACPQSVFEMVLSQEGFYIPKIANERCIDCGICERVCSFNSDKLSVLNKVQGSFSAYSKDSKVRRGSTSGGIASELSKLLLSESYKVIGVEYNYASHRAKYDIGSDEDSIFRFQGSKYIQSDINGVIRTALSRENSEQKYLVIGTPCMIDSARRAVELKRREQNFFFVDFFCHGVPSYWLWDRYRQNEQKKQSIKNINKVVFRDKREGWGYDFTLSIRGSGKESFSKASKGDCFHAFYLNNLCLNQTCYCDCKYKNLDSSADLRIGDLWSGKYIQDKSGVSGVIAYTDRGIEALNKLRSCCKINEEEIEIVTESQMKGKLTLPPQRESVIRDLVKGVGMSRIYWEYIVPIKCLRFVNRCINKAKQLIRI